MPSVAIIKVFSSLDVMVFSVEHKLLNGGFAPGHASVSSQASAVSGMNLEGKGRATHWHSLGNQKGFISNYGFNSPVALIIMLF